MSLAGVVLAAGASRRLGRPKQTVSLGGEVLVERAVRVAQEAGLEPVIVVVVASGVEWAAALRERGCVVVVNEQADEGMAASIRCGAGEAAALGAAGVVVMTCDQVAMCAEHLRALCAEPETITGSGYAGKIGIPAYFPVGSFGALMQLRGDGGAREMLRAARVVVDEALDLDVDTEEDVERARMILGR